MLLQSKSVPKKLKEMHSTMSKSNNKQICDQIMTRKYVRKINSSLTWVMDS